MWVQSTLEVLKSVSPKCKNILAVCLLWCCLFEYISNQFAKVWWSPLCQIWQSWSKMDRTTFLFSRQKMGGNFCKNEMRSFVLGHFSSPFPANWRQKIGTIWLNFLLSFQTPFFLQLFISRQNKIKNGTWGPINGTDNKLQFTNTAFQV